MWLVWDVLRALGSGIAVAAVFVVVFFVWVEISYRLWPPPPKPAPKLRSVCELYEYIDPETGHKKRLWASRFVEVEKTESAPPDAA